MEIELDILFNTEESRTLTDLGMNVSDEMLTTRKVTFYRIDTIEPSDEKGYSNIIVGGEMYTTPMKYKDLKNLISEQTRRRNALHGNQ